MNPASEAKNNLQNLLGEFAWTFNITLLERRGAAQIEPACYGELSTAKPHRDLVRAVPSARYAHPIRIGSPPTAVDVIGIETTLVRHGGNQHAVAIDVDETRGRPTPEEVHRLQAVHFVTMRVQRDLHRCRCRRWCRGWCGGGRGRGRRGRCGSRCWRWCRG